MPHSLLHKQLERDCIISRTGRQLSISECIRRRLNSIKYSQAQKAKQAEKHKKDHLYIMLLVSNVDM